MLPAPPIAPPASGPAARPIARGRGWRLHEHVCTAGPGDRRFEERHDGFSISAVAAGRFTYRGSSGTALLHPGALLLGNHGACFECGHEHGRGDRCIGLHIAPELFEEIAAGAAGAARFRFAGAMLPVLPALQAWIARLEACAAGAGRADDAFALRLIEAVLAAAAEAPPPPAVGSAREARRVGEALRAVEAGADGALDLDALAQRAGMSKYHFLRVFRGATGTTPYAYVLETRLRRAATRLIATRERISAIAFDCGFGDLSTFNARFKRRFGKSPRAFRGS